MEKAPSIKHTTLQVGPEGREKPVEVYYAVKGAYSQEDWTT